MTNRTRIIAMLVAMLATAGMASVWMQQTIAAQNNEASLPADVGDLSNASTVEVKDNTGAVVLRGNFVESPGEDDDIERKAPLIGSGTTASSKGEAEIEVAKKDNRLVQDVEVSASNLTPGATYTVFIDAKQVGTFTTKKNGKGEMELTTPSVK